MAVGQQDFGAILTMFCGKGEPIESGRAIHFDLDM